MIALILHDIYDTFSYLKYGLAAALCAALALTIWNHRRCRDDGKQKEFISLLCKSMFLAFYGTVLLQVTLLSREPGSRTATDLIPFSTWGTTAQSRAYEIENMIMFLPVGAFLPLMHRKLRRLHTVTLVLAGLSIGIELIQFVTQRGYLQTDDVIMNVLGGVAGYGFWRLLFERGKNNMKNTTLLIMAAGIGSRFGGGIKQLEPVGLHDEIIMDYSIHDAIEAGFNKIIFIIRKDIEADFKERIGNRVEELCERLGVEVAYTFQDLHNVPGEVPADRTKPWGTGQAVLAAKALIHEPVAVINADDYYGKEAFRKLHDWLVLDHEDTAIAMAGFILKNTLSDNGGVTRGVCKVAEGHTHISDVIETGNIVKTVSETGEIGAEVRESDGVDGVVLNPESYVSMNFWGFPACEGCAPAYLTVLEQGFVEFFEDTVPSNPLKAEYLLPVHIGGLLREGKCTVKALETRDSWFGVTYKEDKAAVVESFKKLIADGVYAEELYSDL